jgi:hypothetical protein
MLVSSAASKISAPLATTTMMAFCQQCHTKRASDLVYYLTVMSPTSLEGLRKSTLKFKSCTFYKDGVYHDVHDWAMGDIDFKRDVTDVITAVAADKTESKKMSVY